MLQTGNHFLSSKPKSEYKVYFQKETHLMNPYSYFRLSSRQITPNQLLLITASEYQEKRLVNPTELQA